MEGLLGLASMIEVVSAKASGALLLPAKIGYYISYVVDLLQSDSMVAWLVLACFVMLIVTTRRELEVIS